MQGYIDVVIHGLDPDDLREIAPTIPFEMVEETTADAVDALFELDVPFWGRRSRTILGGSFLREEIDAESFYLRPAAEMRALFAEVPEALSSTVRIAERCERVVEIVDGRIEDDRLVLDPRTVLPEQEATLWRLVAEAVGQPAA